MGERLIDASEPLSVFAARTLRSQVRSFETWLPQPGCIPSPEDVHELRVAVRHLRVALKLYKDVIPPEGKRLRRELGWLARSLGETRDLDVYTRRLRRELKRHPELAEAIARLQTRAEAARATTRERALRELASDRVAKLRADLLALAHQDFGGTPGTEQCTRAIDEAFRAATRKNLKRLRKRSRAIDERSPREALHRVRIGTKELRYQLELFSPVFPETEPLIDASKRLQRTLGDYNDACIAAARLKRDAAAADRAGVNSAAVDELIRHQEAMADSRRSRFAAEWSRFERVAQETERIAA